MDFCYFLEPKTRVGRMWITCEGWAHGAVTPSVFSASSARDGLRARRECPLFFCPFSPAAGRRSCAQCQDCLCTWPRNARNESRGGAGSPPLVVRHAAAVPPGQNDSMHNGPRSLVVGRGRCVPRPSTRSAGLAGGQSGGGAPTWGGAARCPRGSALERLRARTTGRACL